MKKNQHKKAVTAFVLVAILAILALIFPAREDSTEVTGMLGGGQQLRATPYSKLYEQSQQTPYQLVETKNPCKAVHCGRPIAPAHPVLDNYGKPTTDEYGNVWCKCDGQAELYYRVSPTRKY